MLCVQPIRQSLEEYFVKEMGGTRRRARRVGLSRVVAVAANTFRETVRERVLYNLVFFAILMTLCGLLLGQLSIRQDEKIIKDIGLAAMELFGHLIAIFIGVGLVSKEIERRSLYPLLAKPLSPRRVLPRASSPGSGFTLLVNVGVMAAGLLRDPARSPRGEADPALLKARLRDLPRRCCWWWRSRCSSRPSPPPRWPRCARCASSWPGASPTWCGT